ncbi:hypothetical protein Tco_1277688 [Tanacetum coccineum]
MLVAGLTLLKTCLFSPNLKVIFLLKTSILEWAVDKNGRPRIKGTLSSSASSMVNLVSDKISRPRCDHKLLESSHLVPLSNHHSKSFVVALGKGMYEKYALVLHARYGVWTTSDTTAGQASKPSFLQDLAHLSDLYFQADSAINLVNDSSRPGLRLGYEEFPLFHWYNSGPATLYCPTG